MSFYNLFQMVLLTLGVSANALAGNTESATPIQNAEKAKPTKNEKTPEAVSVLTYLRGLGNGRYLFGQVGTWVHGENPDVDDATNWIQKIHDFSGYWPAYGCVTYDFKGEAFSDDAVNQGVRKMWNRGMIPGLYSWWANPSNPNGRAEAKCEVHKIFAEGDNPVKANFYAQMDRMAVNLRQLQNWGIPVIYTPFVELNHKEKWFGTDGMQNAIALHRLVHDYFSTTKGLKNILWGYHTGSSGELRKYYPGDDYVDILGHSVYRLWGNANLDFFDYDWAISKKRDKGKILWIAELGINSPGKPPRDCFDVLTRLENDYPELCGMVWWGDASYHNIIGNSNGTAFIEHVKIITRDEMPFRNQPVEESDLTE